MKRFSLLSLLKRPNQRLLPEESRRWNRFIDEICSRDLSALSDVQRKAVLCFYYDGFVNNGGHLCYMDACPDIAPAELAEALLTVSNQEIADNYLKAVSEGEKDDWQETDNAFYDFSPSLIDHLMAYVEHNKDVIFK